jgi:WD40 repeat protein
VVVWNAATGAVVQRLDTRFAEVESVAFSKAGGRLAVGGNDGTIEWWNVATGQRLATVTGHVRNVQALAFSPDGSRFASGGDNTTIDIWSAD